MYLLLDNIIYSLQHGGGASVVWTEHISRLLTDPRFNTKFIEYEGAMSNVFRKDLKIPLELLDIKSNAFLSLKRYINLNTCKSEPYIFHSSHYRLDKCKNAKNVTTVHDFVYERYIKGFKQKVHSAQKWNAILNSDLVICISESTKMDLLTFLPHIDENKIMVIHHGVDQSYHPIKFESEYKMLIPFDTGNFILYIGNRNAYYKNFNLAVEVCSKMTFPLIMVGGEPFTEAENSTLKYNLGEGNFIHYHGLSNIELNELYNRCKVFLYPSLYEGFGIPVIEAQRAGAPVICSKSSSITEIVGDSNLCIDNISTAKVCDCIKSLDNSYFRGKEIEKGLANSKRFSWDITYKKTTDAYLSLIK